MCLRVVGSESDRFSVLGDRGVRLTTVVERWPNSCVILHSMDRLLWPHDIRYRRLQVFFLVEEIAKTGVSMACLDLA